MLRKPSSSRSTSNKPQRKPLKTLKLARRDDNDVLEPPTKKHRTSFTPSNPPVFDLTREDSIASSSSHESVSPSRSAKSVRPSQRPSVDVKGKKKETRTFASGEEEDRLWVDKYEPTSEAELAVHKRKVEDVRRWLLEAFEGGPSGKLRKYRRILALTGPAGTAKTATLRVLSRELDFEILEWRNTMSERGPAAFANEGVPDEELDLWTESLFDKFQGFLTRAMTCTSIFTHHGTAHANSQSSSSTLRPKRQLILLEDLPNLLHQPTQMRFQAALRSLCTPSSSSLSEAPGPPIVIIVSDTGLRAEQPDDGAWDSSIGRRWDRKEVLDIRNVLGPELMTSPSVTRVGFNPIAPTLMTKALQALLTSHFGPLEGRGRVGKQPAREVIDIIVGSSNGDIRSAIMALQFACRVDLPASSSKSKGKADRKKVRATMNATNLRTVLEAVTRREQSLVLFHLMGKVLYNKRKLDPPASHLTARDAAKERELDTQLVDPPLLPSWLSQHNRKASRVSIETLAAESPIDSSLLGLYTHQNYTQFCTDIEQCDGVCEGLSWVDCIDGAQLANSPYAFPTLTLSTLHALPTPVPRRGQKVCKPAWFDVRSRELEASDAVGDVLGWLARGVAGDGTGSEASSWTHASVATELGGWLRALDRCGGDVKLARGPLPRTHRSFSSLPWSTGTTGVEVLEENEGGEVEGDSDGEMDVRLPSGIRGADEGKGWLEDDDIEDVE